MSETKFIIAPTYVPFASPLPEPIPFQYRRVSIVELEVHRQVGHGYFDGVNPLQKTETRSSLG